MGCDCEDAGRSSRPPIPPSIAIERPVKQPQREKPVLADTNVKGDPDELRKHSADESPAPLPRQRYQSQRRHHIKHDRDHVFPAYFSALSLEMSTSRRAYTPSASM